MSLMMAATRRTIGAIGALLILAVFGSSQAATTPTTAPNPGGGAGGTVEQTVERQRSLVPQAGTEVSRAPRPDWFSPPSIDGATSTVSFPLRTVKIQGITVLPRDKVEALIAPYRGKSVSLADLQGVANAITRLYADAGYGLSFAVIPEQDVVDGVVRLVAIEVYLTYPFVLSWSMLEAMSAGAVVVGSRTPPVEEVITDGDNGRLVDFFSPDAVAAAVCDALADPSGHEALRLRARQSVIDRYDLKTVCLPQHAALYREITGLPLGLDY